MLTMEQLHLFCTHVPKVGSANQRERVSSNPKRNVWPN